MKKYTTNSLRISPVVLGLAACLLTHNARAAAYYFHVNGNQTDYGIVANSTNAWDTGSPWATAATAAPTVGWGITTNDAHFNSSITPYTVTLNSVVNASGIFLDTATTVNINDAGGGNGAISLNPANDQGVSMAGPLHLNVKVTGPARLCPEVTAGSLYLFGTNTYSGGTYWGYNGTPLGYFNNNNSFGSGTIAQGFSASVVGLVGNGGATITLPNNFSYSGTGTGGAGSGFNFAAVANTPVVCNGNWNLGTVNNVRLIQSSGGSSSPLTLHGAISGTALSLILRANNASAIYLDGASTYAAPTIFAAGPNGGGIIVSVGGNPANLAFNKVSGGSAGSNLGHPITVANGTISFAAGVYTSTLIYTGTGETTDRVIDLAGTTGGATLQSDGSGPLTFTSAFTASGAGSKTLTLQGSNTGTNTIGGAIVDNSSVNKTSLVKAQAGTWVLGGVNTYTGGTTVSGGTLEVSGRISGSVTLSGTGALKLDSATALSGVTLTLPDAPVAGSVNLNFSGNQIVGSLTFGSTLQPTGTYGAVGSGATYTSSTFTGSGILVVTTSPLIVTQPQSATVWAGRNATFSVAAIGPGTLTYQWSHNNVSLGSSATDSSYTVTGAQSGDAGSYTCVVANGNPPDTTTTPAVLTVLVPNAYNSAVLADNPISYWRLDEASGTIAYDYVGGNNGTYNNVLLNKTPGYSVLDSDACIGLQKMPLGQASFVSVANYSAFNFFTSATACLPFTLEGWVCFTNVSGTQRLFSTDKISAPGGYMFGISGPNQLIFTTSAFQDYALNLASPLSANVWYQLAVSCDGSTLYFYVNGQPVGTLGLASSHGGTSSGPMCLGANGDFLQNGANDNSEQVKGFLDEVAIYGTYLGAEILAHYNATLPSAPVASKPTPSSATNYVSLTTTFTENALGTDLHYQWTKVGGPTVGGDSSTLTLSGLALTDAGSYQVQVSNGGGSDTSAPATLTVLPVPTTAAQLGLTNGLVLHLPFDTDYNDISGHNNNGAAVGSPAVGVPVAGPAPIGSGALTYSSDSTIPSYNYVTLGKPSDLVFGASGNFSVAFWVRQAYADIGTTNLPFFGNASGGFGRNLGFALAPGLAAGNSPNGSWSWSMFDGTSQAYQTGTVGYPISDGNWHHLVYVFDRSSTASTYLDGQYLTSYNDSYLGSVDSGAAFNIGQDATGQFNATSAADIDDLGVWRRALTPLEVSGMYLAGVSNSPGVSFAPVVTGTPPASTTISNILGTTLTYGGGAGSQFVLLSNNIVTGPLTNWARVATNASTPGSFTIPRVGGASGAVFYLIKSE